MTSFTHIIFDFDGTIADTESIFAQFDQTLLNEALKREGIQSALTLQETRDLAGNNATSKLEIIAERYNFPAKNQLKLFLQERENKRDDLFRKHPPPIGTNLNTLLSHLDNKYAIATNKSGKRLQHDLNTMGMHSLFDIIVACDPPLLKKPAPDMLLTAAEKLNVAPENCAYIGDNVIDMQAAINAKMTPVAFIIEGMENEQPRVKQLKEAGAEIIIDDFLALLPYVIKP